MVAFIVHNFVYNTKP